MTVIEFRQPSRPSPEQELLMDMVLSHARCRNKTEKAAILDRAVKDARELLSAMVAE